MSNKEKIRELIAYLDCVNLDKREQVITEWLEQNPVEPVVVGLSDEQVHSLAYYIGNGDYDNLKWSISIWQRGQKFAQPKVKEVPVGLSDAQVDSYREKYMSLYDDYQSLLVDKMIADKEIEQLKSQKFSPDWDDAPIPATEATISLSWYNRDGTRLSGKHLFREQRPKPTPQVEVGQVWKHKHVDYIVTHIGKVKRSVVEFGDGWFDCVTYINETTNEYKPVSYCTRTMDDFIAKFERVN